MPLAGTVRPIRIEHEGWPMPTLLSYVVVWLSGYAEVGVPVKWLLFSFNVMLWTLHAR